MLKKLLVCILVVTGFAACKKSDSCTFKDSSVVAPDTEVADLKTYIDANHPGAVKHPSGFYYEIVATGSGGSPDICSNINVTYTGRYINNSIFDQNLTGYVSPLGNLIVGWQKGLPLIQKGGTIKLYIPATLNYGASGGTIMCFDIKLLDFK